MKSSILIAFVIGYILCIWVQSGSESVPNIVHTRTTDTLRITDTLEIAKTAYLKDIKYLTDTLYINSNKVPYTASSYKDSAENYVLAVDAYSPLPVDSFDIKLSLKTDSVIITNRDSVTVIETKGYLDTQGEATLAVVMFLLGAIIL